MNYNTSHVIVIGDYDIEMIIIEKIMGCIRGQLPITYLEISMRETLLKKEDWT